METDLRAIAIGMAVLILSLSFHEFAHAWAAYRVGDSLPRSMGRLTVNPFAHTDLWGTIIFPALCIASGTGIFFGWAKPVMVSSGHSRAHHVFIAAAGPIMNLLIACVAAALLRVPALHANFVLRYFVFVNLALAVFNLLPIYPLDGSKVLEGILPRDAARAFASTAPFGFFILAAFIMLGLGGLVVNPTVHALAGVLL